MAWPLFAMGFVFGAAAFSIRLGRYAWHVLFLGTGAALIFNLLLIASSGAAALYSWELGTNLQNRIFTDFELDILAFIVQPMTLLLLAVSALVLWVRGGKPGPEVQAMYSPVIMPEAAPGPLELPAVPATGSEAKPAEVSAPQPAAATHPDSPLDAIAPGSSAPAETPGGAPDAPTGPVAEASTSAPPAPPAPAAPEKAAGPEEFTP
jgi:hypothetical protein